MNYSAIELPRILARFLKIQFATVNNAKVNKQSRIEATVLYSVLPISKSEVCKILPDVSPTTVELVLSLLLKQGKIVKVGVGKNTHYLKKS